jgi:hypothetical protein
MKSYTASKSRSQGREAWSVIYRHPARLDPTTGQGRRIRRGLGTNDAALADELVAQLNEILAEPALWDAAQRGAASGRFDPRVVDIFFDGLEPSRVDYRAARDALMPLPGSDEGYRHVLMLGTTGAGKTTLVRQLLGHRTGERFPSTSTAKTTVADTEIVLNAAGPFRVVATFASRDEVVDHLTDNASAAAAAIFAEKGDAEVTRRLLDHVNQRFRFSYTLGRPKLPDPQGLADDDLDDDLDEDLETDGDGASGSYADADERPEAVDDWPQDDSNLDLAKTEGVVLGAVQALRDVVRACAGDVRASLEIGDNNSEDERVLQELLEETLDFELRSREEFHAVVDALLEEIEARFAVLADGDLRRSRQGWPVTWSFEHEDRQHFLRSVARLSSNYAPAFGRLLTPLVNGLRVSGPFTPAWVTTDCRLVLVDVEGLGHTAKSTTTLSTALAKRLEEVDEVVLVDNATQPMQAAPLAAMKAITVSGNAGKLSFVFTHFDQVTGPNMRTFGDAEEHVMASAENALAAVEDDLGPVGERALRRRLDGHRYFVGGIQTTLDGSRKAGRRSLRQLESLVADLTTAPTDEGLTEARPVISRMNLSLAVAEAAKTFQERWRGLLGLEYSSENPKEHWTRIKALTRRLGEGWDDQYDNLMPVAELRNELQRQLFLMLQRPVRWDGDPSDDDKQQIVESISNAFTGPLFALTTRRLKDDVQTAWLEAYSLSGRGSTFVRARHISDRVYGRGAPIPTVAASREGTEFLREIADLVDRVATDLGLILE